MLKTEPITPSGPYWSEVNDLALEAFPPEEYLAPETLAEMARADNFDFLALTDGGAFVGFLAVQTYRSLAYLFFLAIVPSRRSMGYGSQAIAALKAAYPGKKQVVDFERVDASAENYGQRVRRREFYLRNGYRETGLFLRYLGVAYEVFCMDEDFRAEEFQELMQTIRVEGFHPEYFRRQPSPAQEQIGGDGGGADQEQGDQEEHLPLCEAQLLTGAAEGQAQAAGDGKHRRQEQGQQQRLHREQAEIFQKPG